MISPTDTLSSSANCFTNWPIRTFDRPIDLASFAVDTYLSDIRGVPGAGLKLIDRAAYTIRGPASKGHYSSHSRGTRAVSLFRAACLNSCSVLAETPASCLRGSDSLRRFTSLTRSTSTVYPQRSSRS